MKLFILLVIFFWLFIFVDTSIKKIFREKHKFVFMEAQQWLNEERFKQGVLKRAFYYYAYSAYFWPIPSFAIFLIVFVAIIFI